MQLLTQRNIGGSYPTGLAMTAAALCQYFLDHPSVLFLGRPQLGFLLQDAAVNRIPTAVTTFILATPVLSFAAQMTIRTIGESAFETLVSFHPTIILRIVALSAAALAYLLDQNDTAEAAAGSSPFELFDFTFGTGEPSFDNAESSAPARPASPVAEPESSVHMTITVAEPPVHLSLSVVDSDTLALVRVDLKVAQNALKLTKEDLESTVVKLNKALDDCSLVTLELANTKAALETALARVLPVAVPVAPTAVVVPTVVPAARRSSMRQGARRAA
jgi:hypothetical protein